MTCCALKYTLLFSSIETDPSYDPKKDKGASLRLCGVTIGSGNLLRREEELAALACVLPANPAVRKKCVQITLSFSSSSSSSSPTPNVLRDHDYTRLDFTTDPI
jgi:hypothetical protein